ncbi:hypothetical protein [Brucella grignonensis]|uniref:Uncharacterized protein n=1 Tax=Brucella grignonensis TaxID=94627 RepID=A0A256GIJ9_9HYPH|nr:hypothetical protein [Brucella grignonensis]OYR26770.1 hypothetical protein CEV33_4575 [Brucella grignonensis]
MFEETNEPDVTVILVARRRSLNCRRTPGVIRCQLASGNHFPEPTI